MDILEIYIAVAVTLLFVVGLGLTVLALRESRRVRKQWNRQA
jgi:preprotein translocase subunit SecG